MLLQAMRKIQRKMDTNRHEKERDTDRLQWEIVTMEGKKRETDQSGIDQTMPRSPCDWVTLLRVVM